MRWAQKPQADIDTANAYATTAYFSSVPLPLQLPSPQPAALTPPYNPAQIFDPHLKTPYNLQYSGSLEQGLGAARRDRRLTYTGSGRPPFATAEHA